MRLGLILITILTFAITAVLMLKTFYPSIEKRAFLRVIKDKFAWIVMAVIAASLVLFVLLDSGILRTKISSGDLAIASSTISTLESNNFVIAEENKLIYAKFNELLKDPTSGEKAVVWASRVKQVRMFSNEAFEFVTDLKKSITLPYLQPPGNIGNATYDIHRTKVLIKEGRGQQLFSELNNYKRQVLGLFETNADGDDENVRKNLRIKKSELDQTLNINSTLGIEGDHHEDSDHWVETFFYNRSDLQSVVFLTTIQNSILTSENQVASYFAAQLGTTKAVFDEFQPDIRVGATNLVPGQELNLSISIPSVYVNHTYQISIDNIKLELDGSGTASYRKKVRTPGRYALLVKINYRTPTGNDQNWIRRIPYIVSSGTIKPTLVKKMKSGILGYSYPDHIRRSTSKSINVFLSVVNNQEEIRDTLKKTIVLQQEIVEMEDTIHLETTAVILYKYLTVTLVDPDTVFRVTQIHNKNRQLIDTLHGNKWRWNISTNSDRSSGLLILKIVSEGPNEVLDDRNLNIHIDINNSSLFRRIWIYLLDNPAIIVTVILIPVIAFFAKRWLDRKKNKT